MVETATAPRRAASAPACAAALEDVVVIGAGPAGLAAAGALAERGVTALVVDAAPDVASSWRGRYDRLRLNTPRWLAHLPGARLPRRLGRWPTREDYIAYLEAYARERVPRRRHGVRVQGLRREQDGWVLDTSAGELRARNVVVATGYDRVPHLPEWPGRESFRGTLLHAADYRTPEPFRGRDVLVVGAGTSGNEIAVHLLEGGAARVRVSVRTRPWMVPRDWHGIPMPALAYPRPRPPGIATNRGMRLLDRLIWGDLCSVGLAPAQEGVTTMLERTGHGAGTDSGMFAAVRAGRIEVLPAVASLEEEHVVVADGRRVRADVVIAATGYRCGLEELLGDLPGVLREDGRPRIGGAVQAPSAPGLFPIGYHLPLSGQLPELRRDARAIVRAVQRRRPDPAAAMVGGRRRPLARTPWKRGRGAAAGPPAIVSLTDFQVQRFRDLVPVAVAGLRLRRRWRDRPGSLGLSLWGRPGRRRVGSLSAWESEADLRRFLSSPEHVAVVRRFRGRMWNVGSATWPTERFDVGEAWREAGRRWTQT